jgi:hypothetical protein
MLSFFNKFVIPKPFVLKLFNTNILCIHTIRICRDI